MGCIPLVPPGWFKVDAGLGDFLACDPTPGIYSIGERVGHCGQLHPLPLHWILDSLAHVSPCLSPMSCKKTVGLFHLAMATSIIVTVWITIAASSAAPPSMATFPRTTQGIGITTVSSGPCQGSH